LNLCVGGVCLWKVLRVVKRRYVLMVLVGETDCVPMPKTISEKDATGGGRSTSLSKRVVTTHSFRSVETAKLHFPLKLIMAHEY